MHLLLGSLVAGAIAGEGARKLAWRPLFRGAIKQGLRLQRGLLEVSAGVHIEANRLVSEAREDLDGPHPAGERKTKSKRTPQ